MEHTGTGQNGPTSATKKLNYGQAKCFMLHSVVVPSADSPLLFTTIFKPIPGSTAPMSTLRTFIVEDNPIILNNLVDTLEELTDLKVVGAVGSEEEAVRELKIRAQALDLVIVDVFLNSGSGLGVLKSAQQMGLPARCVVLTNYASDDIRRRCAHLGADAVFDKSKELEDLIEYCEKLTSA